MGIGPTFAGALSDWFHDTYGQESLRYSLMTTIGFLVPAAVAFYYAAGSMIADEEP
jgi:hypothetical protein